MDLETGGNPDEPIIDNNGDGIIDDDDRTDVLDEVLTARQEDRLLTDDTITQDHLINDRDIDAIRTAPPRQTGRISWQELLR